MNIIEHKSPPSSPAFSSDDDSDDCIIPKSVHQAILNYSGKSTETRPWKHRFYSTQFLTPDESMESSSSLLSSTFSSSSTRSHQSTTSLSFPLLQESSPSSFLLDLPAMGQITATDVGNTEVNVAERNLNEFLDSTSKLKSSWPEFEVRMKSIYIDWLNWKLQVKEKDEAALQDRITHLDTEMSILQGKYEMALNINRAIDEENLQDQILIEANETLKAENQKLQTQTCKKLMKNVKLKSKLKMLKRIRKQQDVRIEKLIKENKLLSEKRIVHENDLMVVNSVKNQLTKTEKLLTNLDLQKFELKLKKRVLAKQQGLIQSSSKERRGKDKEEMEQLMKESYSPRKEISERNQKRKFPQSISDSPPLPISQYIEQISRD